MIRCQGFLKLGTGHSVKHRCLNALSPSLAPAKAHIVASLTLMTVFSLHFFPTIVNFLTCNNYTLGIEEVKKQATKLANS